jgi:Ca-activated chloride channel family protein
LTNDQGFFRTVLDEVDVGSAPRGGTLIGDAIRKAGELLNDKVDAHKVILLITDGEDQESFPVEAAAGVWKDQQIPVIAVALGDSEHGARIPVPAERGEGYLKYGDEVVWTKANFDELRKVAGVSPQGMFIAVGTSNFGEIYRRVASGIRYDEEAQQRLVRQPTRYHPFAVAALVLLLIESCLREAPRRPATTLNAARKTSEKAA